MTALAGERRLELEQAAGIAGDDDIGIERSDERGFAIAEGVCGGGLDEIVNSRGAATDGGLRNFEKLEAGDSGEKLARLRADTLSVLQMAGIVERDAQRQRMASSDGRQV